MKKLFPASFLVSSMLFICCNTGDSSGPNISPSTVNTTVANGTWRVSLFNDNGVNKTAQFDGFRFTFGASNMLTAVNGGTTIAGSWVSLVDDSKTKIDINFTSPSSFAAISEDWHVTGLNANKVEMQHVSGSGGGADYLMLER